MWLRNCWQVIAFGREIGSPPLARTVCNEEIVLFRTADEYCEFYSKIARIPPEEARRSKGHAWRDYYATWYEAPGDPVHTPVRHLPRA